MGTFLGVPIIRTIVYWGPILGSPYFGKLPYRGYVGGIWGLSGCNSTRVL